MIAAKLLQCCPFISQSISPKILTQSQIRNIPNKTNNLSFKISYFSFSMNAISWRYKRLCSKTENIVTVVVSRDVYFSVDLYKSVIKR
jgi:hypothetical protein